jgi:uroporphyrinogen III methyltransferase / synthase
MSKARKTAGRITFVGAGPGDPGLLTVRAAEVLRAAQVVVLDPDVPEALVQAGGGSVAADVDVRPAVGEPADVAKVLVAEAKAGRNVVRLVSGDPFTDDTVVKEALAVGRTSVPFDVVPGVPATVGTPTYAGVPLGSAYTTADVRDEVDWAVLAAAQGPLVLQATATHLGKIAAALSEHGMPASTPACATAEGTGSAQQSVLTTLAELERQAGDLAGPLVVTVGAVATQAAKLGWWESRALYGWKVLVPRTKEQAAAMSERLRQHGASSFEVPTIAVEPPRTPAQMERAIKGLVTGRYEWIVFTSTNAVRAIREKFTEFGLDARAFAGVKIACVGEATADAVRSFGIEPELLPSGEQSSAGLLEVFPPYDAVLDPIDRVLLPRADIATETLAEGLRARGWEIDDVTAYRTVRAAPPPADTREAIKTGGFDAVCFTSSSTVRNLVGIAGKPHTRTVVACIGPQTAATAREFGLRVDVEPEVAEIPALVDALASYAAQLRDSGQVVPPSRKTKAKGRAAR